MQQLTIDPNLETDVENLDEFASDVSTSPESDPMRSTQSPSKQILIISIVCAVALGLLTGWGTHRLTASESQTSVANNGVIETVPEGNISNGDVFGNPNTEVFKDSATGYLEEGGLDGEGSHKLLRPGGPSQTVYLTSSVTDLDEFVGMEISVAGETFKGQKAGWLMDVGRVEVLETNGEAPIQ